MSRAIVYFLSLFFCGLTVLSFSQSALKLEKQKTKFCYTQFNLHAGYMDDINGNRWDFASKGPNNQIAFQFLSKNKKTLQRGYTPLFLPNSYKIRAALNFNKTVNNAGKKEINLKFVLLDTWVKFNTKWDRTTVVIGNKSIPYGHNPQLDPVSNFRTNIIKMDLGLAQDLGIFIKTPVANSLDLELSITSGGILNQPLLICDNLVKKDGQEKISPKIVFSEYSYDNTWLVTTRLGTPTFKKTEMGLIGVAGRLYSNLVKNDFNQIFRGGIDWVRKSGEKIKYGNQITFGETKSDKHGWFHTINVQNSADLFVGSKVVLSASHAFNYLSGVDNGKYHFNSTFNNSITYTISTHTRFRINHYHTNIFEANEKQSGVLFQFVTGIGQRG